MAQFIAFEEGVEVSGQTILSIAKALPVEQETKREILHAHGIINPVGSNWYSQQAWLNAFKELSERFGEHLLFRIGEMIPEHAAFPPCNNSLEHALKAIDKAYQLNHRGGEIGSYRLVEFREKEKKAVMICQTPYPSEIDRGLISAVLQKYSLASSAKQSVHLDTTKISRTRGSHSCTYRLFW